MVSDNQSSAVAAFTLGRVRSTGGKRLLIAAALTGAAVSSVLVPRALPADPALARLVVFMVAMKAVLCLALTAATLWRLRQPGPALGYAAVLGLAAAGPGLVMGASPGWGALALHGGVAAFALLAWRDRAGWRHASRLSAAR